MSAAIPSGTASPMTPARRIIFPPSFPFLSGTPSAATGATPATGLSPAETAAVLPLRFASYNTQHEFHVGQLVRWKEGLKNRVRPDYKQPAIVVEILAEPAIQPLPDSLGGDVREKLDVVLGIITEEQLFSFFHFDKKRFEPYIGP